MPPAPRPPGFLRRPARRRKRSLQPTKRRPKDSPGPTSCGRCSGRNELARKKADSILKRLFKAFINPFTVVLIVLAVISFITDYVIVEPEDRDLTAVLIVGIMVFISGTLRFVQEVRSGNAAERLQAMVKTTIAVLRDGESRERPISELVVGDVIRLAAGDMIPADVRIVETKDLFRQPVIADRRERTDGKVDRRAAADGRQSRWSATISRSWAVLWSAVRLWPS